jgi:hypothetical protein
MNPIMRFRLTLCFVFILVLTSGSSAQDLRFSITPFLSYDSYRGLGFEAGMNAGLSAQFRFTEELTGGATFSFGDRDITVDLISTSGRLTAHLVSYSAEVEVRVAGDSGGMELSLAAGAGGVTSSTDGMRLSLGAAGKLDIPSRSDTRNFVEVGAHAFLPLSKRIAVSLHPSIRAFSPLSHAVPDVIIAGGLRVGIF